MADDFTTAAWSPQELLAWQCECMHWLGEILTGNYAHYCSEWDDLPVDDTSDEFACCGCFQPTPEFLAARAAIGARLDARRESDPDIVDLLEDLRGLM